MKTGQRHIAIKLFCGLCFAALSSIGAEVQFTWNPSQAADVTVYKLYHTATTNAWPTDWTVVATQTNMTSLRGDLTVVLTNVPLGSHRWILTAVTAFGVESDPSNEAMLTLEKPGPPLQLRIGPAGTTTATLLRSFDMQTWQPVYAWTEPTNSASYFCLELGNTH